jgi:hypothetical protein
MWQCSISNSGFVFPKWQRKIYNVVLQAGGGWRHCGLRDGAGSTVLQALWHHRDDNIVGSGRTITLRAWGRRGVDSVMGSGMSWAHGGWRCCGPKDSVGLMVSWSLERRGVHSIVGSGTTTVLWGRWHHQHGSRKIAVRKGGSIVVKSDGAEAPGRTWWWCGLRGGQRRHRLQKKFWWEMLAARWCEWKPPQIMVCKGRTPVYL